MNPAGQVALVIGGATGLMASVSRELARLGAHLAVHAYTHRREAEALVAELRARGSVAEAFEADLTRPEAAAQLADAVCDRLGPPTLLAYGASPFERVSCLDAAAEAWDRALSLEIRAPAILTAALKARGGLDGGLVLLMGDLAGEQGWPPFGPHSVARAGALMLSRLLAVELAPSTRVNVLSPGAMEGEGGGPLGRVPLKRGASEGDVLQALRYLIEADYVTGSVLRVDGGRLAQVV